MKRLEGLVAAIGTESFRRRCDQVDDWRCLFDRAFEQGVAGALAHRIAAVGFPVPAEVLVQAERQFAVDRLWHRRTATDLQRALGSLEQHHLRAVVLKGLVLGERLYSEATLRPAGDLDLLIAASDLSRALAALAPLGYSQRVWKRHETPPAHAAVLEHPNGGTIDLHHLASAGFGTTIAAGGLIDRSVPYRTEGGGPAWILSPEDELLYLAVHAARHRFARLGWLYDLKLFIERHPELRWDAIGTRARALHVRRAASVTCEVLERRLQLSLPAAAREALRPDARVRAAVLLASTATDRPRLHSGGTGGWAKIYRVFCGITFQALLGEGIVSGLGYWWHSMLRSAGKLRQSFTRIGHIGDESPKSSRPLR